MSRMLNDRVQPSVDVDWSAVRREFPATRQLVYLDTARKSLLPVVAREAANAWFDDIDRTGGARAFALESVEAARAELAAFIGAPSESLAYVKNTADGLNAVAQSIAFAPGDNVVVTTLEHENNVLPWRHLQRRGVELRYVTPDADGTLSADRFAARVDRRTRVVATSWVAYSTGQRLDIRGIAEIAHAVDALVVVDAIQGLGLLDQPVATLGADIVVSGGHKMLLSPVGAGLLYFAPTALVQLTPPFAGKNAVEPADRFSGPLVFRDDARRFEYGNPNALAIAVQRRSITFLAALGRAAIERRILALGGLLFERLAATSFDLLTPSAAYARAGIVSIRAEPGMERLVATLREEGCVLSLKDGFLRASIYIYNDESDIERFANLLLSLWQDIRR